MAFFRSKGNTLFAMMCISFIAISYLWPSEFVSLERIQSLSSANRVRENSTRIDFHPIENDEGDSTISFGLGVSSTTLASKEEVDGIIHKPNCTNAVVLSLHREKYDHSNKYCEGLLIRDDIILTSRSCSRYNVTFTFPTGHVMTAVPHATLNSNEFIHSKLGFLQANPTYHYQFIDHGVRRNRVFLSLNETSANGSHVAMSCFQNKPIAHNFPVSGELISLGHLHQLMPDALWEHIDVATAAGYTFHGQRWWSRSVTLQKEKEIMMTLFDKYRGPYPGSIDILSAHQDYMDDASAMLEAEDPRGHRGYYCYRNYYYPYKEEVPFSGEMFFDWLDFGRGKNIFSDSESGKRLHPTKEEKECSMRNYKRKYIYQFNNTERLENEVLFEMSDDGTHVIARYRQSGMLVPKGSIPRHPHLYMWDLNGAFYVADNSLFEKRFGGLFKHTSILASMPALSAGEIYVGQNGTVFGVNYLSGHYRPSIGATALMYQWFQKQGLGLSKFHWVGMQGWSMEDCVTYDWTGMKVPGYDHEALNHSCHEVTQSDKWIGLGKALRRFKKQLKS